MPGSAMEASDTLILALKNRTTLRANDEPIPRIPIQPVPTTTPPLTRRRLPERGSFAALHNPSTDDDLYLAPQRLCTYRGILIEYITEDDSFRMRGGSLREKYNWRLKAIASEDDLRLKDPNTGLRRNINYRTVEEMEAIKQHNKSPSGESSLRHQVQRTADPRVSEEVQQHRRVGEQYTRDMLEGDIEESGAVEGDVDYELEEFLLKETFGE